MQLPKKKVASYTQQKVCRQVGVFFVFSFVFCYRETSESLQLTHAMIAKDISTEASILGNNLSAAIMHGRYTSDNSCINNTC